MQNISQIAKENGANSLACLSHTLYSFRYKYLYFVSMNEWINEYLFDFNAPVEDHRQFLCTYACVCVAQIEKPEEEPKEAHSLKALSENDWSVACVCVCVEKGTTSVSKIDN